MNKLLVCITAILLAGCGGNDSSTDTSKPDPIVPQPTLPAKINGTVTNIASDNNSITVNGYSVNIANAKIHYGQQPLEVNAIQMGMRVKIDNEGQQAKNVILDPSLVGEISSVNQNTIAVNGINLVVKPADATQYKVGDWVAVNGYPTVMGEWQVNSINLIPNFAFAEIEGRVSGLNKATQQFNIGSAVINYANARLEGSLQEGAWVEVEGQQSSASFLASEVEVEDTASFNDMELEGTITWVNQDKTQFELNARTRLYVTTNTQFEDGKQANLVEGKLVDVDIQSMPQGLWAREVEFETSHDNGGIPPTLGKKFELEGLATLTTNNQLQINGFTFDIDARTQFDDGLTLATLDQKWIQIEGVELADKQWLVKEVDLEVRSNELDLSGLVMQKTLWGYQTTDTSLTPFEGKWVDVECQFDGSNIYNCRIDD